MNFKFNEEEDILKKRQPKKPSSNILVKLLLSLKIVNDKDQANYLLLGASVLLILISVYFVHSTFSEDTIDDKYYYDASQDVRHN